MGRDAFRDSGGLRGFPAGGFRQVNWFVYALTALFVVRFWYLGKGQFAARTLRRAANPGRVPSNLRLATALGRSPLKEPRPRTTMRCRGSGGDSKST